MSKIIQIILVLYLLFGLVRLQKKVQEKGESDFPFLVNMWIPRNEFINQRRPRFCDAIQLTPFTDYFFTSAKCFDNLEHDMWLENIGISWDSHVVTYSRHMSFLTRFKEEGGHFVILERFETNPLSTHQLFFPNDPENMVEISKKDVEEVTVPSANSTTVGIIENATQPLKKRRKSDFSQTTTTTAKISEMDDEDYEEFPPDLAQYDDIEDQYEINEQILKDEEDMRILRSLRKKRVRLSTPEVKGATECYVLGWSTYLRAYNDITDLEGLVLRKEVVTKLPRKLCKSSDPSHICVVKDNENRECVEDLGSPLICEKKDSRNKTIGVALVGIYTGFKNCVTTDMGIFRSLSAELPWIARWAKGTPITTRGFGRKGEDTSQSYYLPRKKKSWRRRGRSSSEISKFKFNFILLACSVILEVFITKLD